MDENHPLSGYISTMFKRHITSLLLQALSDTPIILLNGARQTGKSTLTKQLISKNYPAQYITLDDIDILNAARVDPVSFINNFRLWFNYLSRGKLRCLWQESLDCPYQGIMGSLVINTFY